jgi:hypothetical protein
MFLLATPGDQIPVLRIFVGVHLWGVGEALKLCLIITVIASVALLVFVLAMVPYFDAMNLFEIPPQEGVAGASSFLPFGWLGVWAANPYGIWFFSASRACPGRGRSNDDPKTTCPRLHLGHAHPPGLRRLHPGLRPGGSSALRISDLNDR